MPQAHLENFESDSFLEGLLDPAALARIEQPIARAGTLPNAAYTSDAFLRLENQRLFARGWMLAGFVHQIPGPGDVAPLQVAGVPLILLRDTGGTVRVFHNVCPHRGTRLVAEPCAKRKSLTCPYHAWSFDLTGKLRGRPHFHGPGKHDRAHEDNGGSADDRPRLAEVRCDRWMDLIFVNLSGDAPPLEDYLAPLTDRLKGYDLAALRHAGSLTFEVEANWKLVHENYIEPYHVFNLHPRLAAFAPMEIRKPTATEGACFHNEYFVPAPEEGRGEGLPHYPGLPQDWQRRGLWFHLFPSLSLEIYADQLSVLHVTPLGPERSREEIHIYLIGEAAEAAAYRAARQRVFDTWRDLNHEDLGILERLQQGRHSPGFDGGHLSPFWDEATHHFARLVVEGLRSNADGQ